MEIKVSVIVPVYNEEVHLRQCLNSICGQTLQEIEIICVDDGSTDTSHDILKDYAAADERIFIYRQENRYAGAARNLGKRHATGEYLVFWDSDDFFEPNALEEMYQKASAAAADVCVCGANQYLMDKERLVPAVKSYLNEKYLPKEDVFCRETWEEHILNFTTAVPWNKMFRRAFIEDIHLDFKEIRNGNDVYFVINALCQAKRVTTVRKALVTYRVNQTGSLVGTLSKSPLSPIETWAQTAENLIVENCFPERSFVNKALDSMIYLLRNINGWDAFVQAVMVLKESGLQRMRIIDGREDSYYYSAWYAEVVSHLWKDSPEEVLIFLAYRTYFMMKESNADKQEANRQKRKALDEVKRLSAVQKERDGLQEKLEQAHQQKADLDKNLKKLNRERKSFEEKIRKQEDEKALLAESLEDKEIQIAQKEQEIENLRRQVLEGQTTIEALERKCSDLEGDLMREKREVFQLREEKRRLDDHFLVKLDKKIRRDNGHS